MAHLQSRQHVSPDSGFPVTLHPLFNPKTSSHVPPEPIRNEITPPPDRASCAGSTYEGKRRGIRTTVFGEKPYFDSASESRNERRAREKRQKEEKERERERGDGVAGVKTPA
ncbi:hypothetical protein BDW72DRAFT_190880 [Aspergillus terricola var. indicus]